MTEKPKIVLTLKKTLCYHPHLQLKMSEDKKLSESKDMETLRKELSVLETTLKSETAKIPQDPSKDMSFFHQCCPDAEKLLDNPDAVDEAETGTSTGAFTTKPYTNREKYGFLYWRWASPHEWEKGWKDTPKGKIYLSHETKIHNMEEKIRLLRNKIDWLTWANDMIADKSVTLSTQGIAFIDHIIAQPRQGTNRRYSQLSRRGHNTEHNIYSLLLPIAFSDQKTIPKPEGTDDVVRFHISRDDAKDFTEDGNTLIFTENSGGRTKKIYGLIYPQSNEFWPRSHYHIHCDPIDRAITKLLTVTVSGLFDAIATDPEKFFSEIGKKYGMCMFCGRELSDADSITRGYGRICGGGVGFRH
jgi:hypothetical protein